MISYNTHLSNRPPISADMQANALAGINRQAPSLYGQNARDVYRAAASGHAADYARAAGQANLDYATAQQQAERTLALQGLRQMDLAQQQQSQYGNSLAGSLLGGLFR